MEQATAHTHSPAPVLATFQHAHDVVGRIVPYLERQPFAVEIEEDWPSGWRAHLKFRETRGAGLLELASLLDVPVTSASTAFGVHLDAIARIEDVEIRGSALVSPEEAARLEGESVPARAQAAPAEEAPAAQPVPLGSSVLAEMPAIVSVLPAPSVHLDDEDEARCSRCGCTQNVACEGGCYWVPNRQMIDLCSACASPQELAAMTYTAAPIADQESGQ